MITVRAGSAAIGVCLLLLLSACSREQQDWRSAESADTIDSYGQFIQRHPDSELVTQARARVAQLGEDRDWQRAGSADTVDAYREFIAQHPSGKWAQEAHIRIENFSLGEQSGADPGSKSAGTAATTTPRSASAPGGTAAPAAASAPSVSAGSSAATSAKGPQAPRPPSSPPDAGTHSYGLAQPGDAATPPGAAPPPRPAAGTAVASAGSAAAPPPPRPAAGSTVASAGSPAGATGNGAPTAGPGASRPGAGPQASGAYGVQLGAFSTEATASSEWRVLTSKFPDQLRGLSQHVVPANNGSARIYRLQAMVGDESRARAICVQLRTYGQACVAVLPH